MSVCFRQIVPRYICPYHVPIISIISPQFPYCFPMIVPSQLCACCYLPIISILCPYVVITSPIFAMFPNWDVSFPAS